MEAYYAVAPAAPDTSRATRVVRVALLRACSRRPRAGDRDAARCSACHPLNSRLAAPHVTGLWPWNLALEMAARSRASLDGNHAAPPVADARVGPGGLLPPVPSGAVASRCAREASALHLSPHASHLLMLGTTPCPGRGWAGERVLLVRCLCKR